MTLKARNDIHLARRLWHFCGVMFIVFLASVLNHRQTLWVAISMSTFMIGFDLLRLFSKRLNRFFTWLFGPFLRESERTGLTGSAFMMAGVTLIVWLYPKNVVILTLILFAVADPLASYFGIRFGKDKLIGNKSFQGSAAAFVACFVASGAYFATHRLMTDRLFIVCLLSGLIGAISELVPIGKLDDNFVFPVLSATMLTGMFYVFGGL
jgi:dolichol kinase